MGWYNPPTGGGGGGVTSWSAASTGLTPSSPTTGAVVLGGTLAVANGGTGVTSSSGASSVVLRDANANITTNNFLAGFTSTAASGSTITLTVASTPNYVITGSGGQTIKLPDATTLPNGIVFTFNNNQSSGTIVVQNNSGTTITTVQSGGFETVILLSNATAAGTWDYHPDPPSNASWSANTLSWAGSYTNGTWNGTAIGTLYGGTGLTAFTSGGAVYATSTSALTTGTLPIASGGTGQTTASAAFNALSPITSTGDLIIGNGTNSATRLGIGTNAYVLTSNGTTASWAALPASSLTVGTTTISSGSSGAILYNNAGTLGNLSTTGSGNVVLATSPSLVTPAIGSGGATFAGSSSGTTSLVASATASGTLTFPAVTSTITTAATAVGQVIGFVNKVRNGSFVVWTNGTSGSVAVGATGSAAITASGWAAIATGATITWNQVTTGSNGAPRSLKLTGNTSVTDITLGQRIESYDAAALAGQTCTFQIVVTNNTGASITPTIATRYAGSTDNWTSPVADLAATNLQTVTNGSTATLAYTLAVSANAINGYEIKIDFGNNFSTNAKSVTVTAADFRLTPNVATGTNASPPTPELQTIAAQIERCIRYFQASYDNGTAPGANTHAGMVNAGPYISGSLGTIGNVNFRPMRSAPTIAYWDGATNASKVSYFASSSSTWVDNASAGIAPFNISTTGFALQGYTGGSSTSYVHFTAYSDFW